MLAVDRNIALKHQANVDLLGSMPDANQFWDRLTGIRRAKTMQKTPLVLLKVGKGASGKNWLAPLQEAPARRPCRAACVRQTDIPSQRPVRVVLPETDPLNGASRFASRTSCKRPRAFGVVFELSVYNYPEDASARRNGRR